MDAIRLFDDGNLCDRWQLGIWINYLLNVAIQARIIPHVWHMQSQFDSQQWRRCNYKKDDDDDDSTQLIVEWNAFICVINTYKPRIAFFLSGIVSLHPIVCFISFNSNSWCTLISPLCILSLDLFTIRIMLAHVATVIFLSLETPTYRTCGWEISKQILFDSIRFLLLFSKRPSIQNIINFEQILSRLPFRAVWCLIFGLHSAKNTVYYRNTLIKMLVSRQCDARTQIACTFCYYLMCEHKKYIT